MVVNYFKPRVAVHTAGYTLLTMAGWDERYRHVYTSAATFTVNSRCTAARFGPLAHILMNGNNAIMEHRMLEGLYRVHRIVRSCRRPNDRDLVTEEEDLFTVIALQDVDPVKVVKTEKCVSSERCATPYKDRVFDHLQWTELLGEHSVLQNSVTNFVKIALASYCPHLFGVLNDIGNDRQHVSSEEATFFIRLSTQPLETENLTFTLFSPNMSEFAVTTKNSNKPLVIGISHCVSPRNMRGSVLYTGTDVHGQTLPGCGRAFAVVVGPRNHVSDKESFMSAGWTYMIKDFLYAKKRRRSSVVQKETENRAHKTKRVSDRVVVVKQNSDVTFSSDVDETIGSICDVGSDFEELPTENELFDNFFKMFPDPDAGADPET